MATTLTQLSGEVEDLVKNGAAAVAQVDGRRGYPVSGLALGSGEVITANHTLGRDEQVQVHFGADPVAAEVVGRDPSTNLALLRTGEGGPAALPSAAITDDAPAVGSFALALGRPGRSVRAALGIIGARGDEWRTGLGGSIDAYVEPNVRMFPGFTGGPLLDGEGNVVGINTRGLAGRTPVTVPATTIERVAEALRRDGHIKRGYLGVSSQQVELPDGSGSGLLILRVEKGGPAEAAGVHLGDTVVAVDGTPVGDHEELIAQLGGDRVGQKLTLELRRTGERVTVDLVVAERPRRS